MSVKAHQSVKNKKSLKVKNGKAKYTVKTGIEITQKSYTIIENGKEVIKTETTNRKYRVIVKNP